MTFEKGKSGNENGRPKGIIDKRTKLRQLIDIHAEDIVNKLVEKAKEGDLMALRLCIERLIPKIKADQGIIFNLPNGRLDVGNNMLTIANSLTLAVASGQLTLKEAEELRGFMRQQRVMIEEAERKISNEEWEKKWNN